MGAMEVCVCGCMVIDTCSAKWVSLAVRPVGAAPGHRFPTDSSRLNIPLPALRLSACLSVRISV